MELEVVGRHALLFDDDANANFVNSKEALVEWNSLFIDRYDVRHLLSSPLASFKRLRQSSVSCQHPDSHLELELDVERYADLPSQWSSDQELPETDAGTTHAGGYHAVSFSYGNTDDSIEQKNADRNEEVGGFCPPFPVPENLAQSLPMNEKVHQIIARTALFVSQHGGQSEIVLRVKQGDNPTFGFLMPHHQLHPYFRYLVDHPELLNSSGDGKSQKGNNSDNKDGSPGTGGALSLLGSMYGSVEDEDAIREDTKESKVSKEMDSVDTSTAGDRTGTPHLEKQDVLDNVSRKDERSFEFLHPSKSTLGKSGVSSTIKSKGVNKGKKEDALGSSGASVNDSKPSARSSTANGESLVVEPPSELKRLVDRIVEIILKNGQGFEALLVEQDKSHGRFPFLLKSNQYHPYYLKALRMAQESRIGAKNFGCDKDAAWQGAEKKTGPLKQSEESAAQDLPFDYDRKEKFKMVIGRTKKEIHEQPSKETQQQPVGISADAAAAILQAATRGIKKPNLDIFSKNHGSVSDGGGGASSLGSLQPSQPQSSLQKQTEIKNPSMRVPVAKEIAKTAAMAAAGEADSSEAGLTREQKLKAERLKRAKMFAAMIKSGGAQSLGKEPPRGLSAEPPGSGLSGSGVAVGAQGAKEREGSSPPADIGASDKMEKSEKHLDNETDERVARKRRHYRSKNHEEEEDGDQREEESNEEDDGHSRKKHRSHHSSRDHRDRSKDKRKHRRRHSSKDKESQHHRHKHDRDSEDSDKHHKHKHGSSSEDEYERRKHKRRSSHKDGHADEKRKHKKRSKSEEGELELEEGEIRAKSSDQSPSVVHVANRGTSVGRFNTIQEERAPSEPPQTTNVPEDLRAKIRAMLLATL